tara:strand:- start:2716 stop:3432 length:717 start_codon:yes stop_codon:yes gene_type:complete
MKLLKNKQVLLTGATGGLGVSLAYEMLAKECSVLLVGTSYQKLTELKVTLIEKYPGSKINFFVSDFNKDSDVSNLLKHVNDYYNIDILINNAGIFDIKNIESSTIEDFDRTMNVNVRIPFILSKCVLKKMKKKKWGRIVNIGSSSSYNGSGETGVYCVSKHALLGLSRSLFAELKKYNVNVYSISPGSIKTPMGATDHRQDYSTFLCPDEIAKYISFLMSFESNGIAEEIRINRIEAR